MSVTRVTDSGRRSGDAKSLLHSLRIGGRGSEEFSLREAIGHLGDSGSYQKRRELPLRSARSER